MTIRTMNIEDFQNIYDLWIHTEGMGLNTTDDSRHLGLHWNIMMHYVAVMGLFKRDNNQSSNIPFVVKKQVILYNENDILTNI